MSEVPLHGVRAEGLVRHVVLQGLPSTISMEAPRMRQRIDGDGLTESVYKIVRKKSIPSQICQPILYQYAQKSTLAKIRQRVFHYC